MSASPNESYKPQKTVWSHADFDAITWHETSIRAIAFEPEKCELLLDIDYVAKWVSPEPPSPYFSFWIAPSTLVFRNVWDINVDLSYSLELQIESIVRENPRPPRNRQYIQENTEWTWTINTVSGVNGVKISGFAG